MTCIAQPFLHPACQIPNKNCVFVLLGLAKGVGMNSVWEDNG